MKKIKIHPEAIKRLKKAKREGLCLACLEKLYGRTLQGLHEKCHRATKRAIERGEFSEEDRICEGKLLPRDQTGRPPSNFVTLEAKRTKT